MTKRIIITGTDTGIGKTVFSAGLANLLGGAYWKPVPSGLDGETDSQTVARLGELTPERILPEAWRLTRPLSPHRAAELEGVTIDPDRLVLPEIECPRGGRRWPDGAAHPQNPVHRRLGVTTRTKVMNLSNF